MVSWLEFLLGHKYKLEILRDDQLSMMMVIWLVIEMVSSLNRNHFAVEQAYILHLYLNNSLIFLFIKRK